MTPAEVEISVAAITDAEDVTALLRASYSELLAADYAAQVLAVALPVMTKANAALLASGRYYIARTTEGLAIACGGWSLDRPGTREIEPGLAHIRHFATHPTWARRGIAGRILERCLQDASGTGARDFECFSTLGAVPFYQVFGFEPDRVVDVKLGGTVEFPSVLMRRTHS